MATKQEKSDDNVIFVGGKPFMNYMTGIITQFNKEDTKEIKIISRGKFISKAVDIAEATKKKFLKDSNIIIKEIKTNSEEFETKEGKKVTVSTMDIVLRKN